MDKDFQFASARLAYRGITADDADTIVRWRNDPENYKWFFDARPITLASHMEWFEGYLKDSTRYDFIIADSCGVPIGTVGISDISQDSCEISYMIGEHEARGMGYASEAVTALCDIAFKEFGISEVRARILPNNSASASTAKSAGFEERERIFTLRREDMF